MYSNSDNTCNKTNLKVKRPLWQQTFGWNGQQKEGLISHPWRVKSKELEMFLYDLISAGSEFQSFAAEFWKNLFPYFTLFVSFTYGNLGSTWQPDLKNVVGV